LGNPQRTYTQADLIIISVILKNSSKAKKFKEILIRNDYITGRWGGDSFNIPSPLGIIFLIKVEFYYTSFAKRLEKYLNNLN